MSLRLNSARLTELFDSFRGLSVAVIGDLMLDRYLHGTVKRISPEAPIPILQVDQELARPGGAANVAWNLARLGARCALVGLTGRDEDAARLKTALRAAGVSDTGIVAHPGRPTIVKTRVVARQQQLLRIDREPAEAAAPSSAVETRLIAAARRALKTAQAVVLSDYVKGCLTPKLVREVLAIAGRRRIPVLVDSKDNRVERYRGADWIKPNRHEAARVVGFELHSDRDYERAGELFVRRTGCRVVAITRGAQGMTLFARSGKSLQRLHGPNHALEVADVTGAGDTAMAIMALMAAATAAAAQPTDSKTRRPGAPAGGSLAVLEETLELANLASGVTVSHLGTYAPTPHEILDLFARHTVAGESTKLLDREVARARIEPLRRRGKKIVFTNGCFDIFHAGHVRTLQFARSQGDLLIVGINSDASVRRQGKAPDRPLVDEFARAMVLSSLACVDHVVIYDEDTPIPLIKLLKPDVLVKGGDYTRKQVVGWQIVEGYGGRVIVAPLVDGLSTTRLVAKIRAGDAPPPSGPRR